MYAIEYRVHQIGDRAVTNVLGIRVVDGVMMRRLKHMRILKERDDATVFFARLMRPFVDFIGVGADGSKQPHLPRQNAECPRARHHQRRDAEQIPRALPPVVARHISRQVMMNDVCLADE